MNRADQKIFIGEGRNIIEVVYLWGFGGNASKFFSLKDILTKNIINTYEY